MARHFSDLQQTMGRGFARVGEDGPKGGPEGGEPGSSHVVAVVVVCAVVCLLALMAVGGWRLYVSAQRVEAEAQQVVGSVDGLKAALKDGDAERLSSIAADVNGAAHGMQNETSGLLWAAGSLLPVVGSDVSSVRSLANVLVDLSDNALTPLAANPDALQLKGLVSDGAVNVERVKELAALEQQLSPVVRRSVQTIVGLPKAHLSQLASALDKVQAKVGKADEALAKADAIVPQLPAMLGADGQTRNYLVVAQNNVELRATGGFAGSWTTLSVTDGVIQMGDSLTLQHAANFPFDWSDEERAVFPMVSVDDPSGVNFTPDFTRAGARFAEAYQDNTGSRVDGVVGIDPVFLQRLLSLTGGVVASDGTEVNGDNAAAELMNGVYWRYPDNPDYQDAFFAEVAGLSFQKVLGGLGDVDVKRLSDVIEKSADDHRLQVWMADADEERAMDGLGMSGGIGQDEATPVLGVYLNDNTWSKIDWYLSCETTVGEGVRNPDGSTTYEVVTSLTNNGSEDEFAGMPEYISGKNPDKRSVGDMITIPLVLGPAGGHVDGLIVSDGSSLDEHTLYGLDAWTGTLHVGAQQTVQLSYKVTVSPKATAPLAVRTTPLAKE